MKAAKLFLQKKGPKVKQFCSGHTCILLLDDAVGDTLFRSKLRVQIIESEKTEKILWDTRQGQWLYEVAAKKCVTGCRSFIFSRKICVLRSASRGIGLKQKNEIFFMKFSTLLMMIMSAGFFSGWINNIKKNIRKFLAYNKKSQFFSFLGNSLSATSFTNEKKSWTKRKKNYSKQKTNMRYGRTAVPTRTY